MNEMMACSVPPNFKNRCLAQKPSQLGTVANGSAGQDWQRGRQWKDASIKTLHEVR
jgi:hypothetical protein